MAYSTVCRRSHDAPHPTAFRPPRTGSWYGEAMSRPDKRGSPGVPDCPQFLPLPKAAKLLSKRLGATAEEIAAWVFMGPEQGGLVAYLNVNEFDEPPRFLYGSLPTEQFDYLAPLMACWFLKADLDGFQPGDRFITGAALVERWSTYEGLDVEGFIQAKVAESRLQPLHPIMGGTQWTEDETFPPRDTALFVLAEVEAVQAEDLDDELSPRPDPRLNYDTELQARANAIAAERIAAGSPDVTRNKVAELLARERGMEPATVLRRIRKQW